MSLRPTTLSNALKFSMKDLEEKVKTAKKEKKIFMVLGGYDKLRQSLVERGWIEKIPDNLLLLVPPNSERAVLALLVKNLPCFFFWQSRYNSVDTVNRVYPVVGSIIRDHLLNFTSKDGLSNCARNHHWYHIEGLTDLNHQRSHVLLDRTSREEFTEDFRRTSFTSFIMFLNDKSENFESLFTSADSGISTDCIEFSIQKIELIIKIENHDDLDTSHLFDVCAKIPKNQKEVMASIRQIVNGSRKLKFESDFLMDICKARILHCAEIIENQWPHLKYDGYNNIWILKPIGQSSGYGVTVVNTLEKVLQDSRVINKTFLVQKYIEKPLIIHERKFDMRIYFITFIREGFVDVWLYKDCYIKFSTPVFRLDNLDRSIHVTNYAVQKHYFMNPLETVPNAKENMWMLRQLVEYFESIDKSNVWSDQIYPGIKKNLLAVILASLEVTELTANNFELNGADFMVGYDFEPVLIEINSKPALYFSQVVVEMITDRLLGDVIKVTVDRQRDPSAPTGDFELIHSFEIPRVDKAFIEGSITGTRMDIRNPEISFRNESSSTKRTDTRLDTRANTKVMLSLKDANAVNPIYLKIK